MKILFISQFYYPEPFRVNEIAENIVKLGNSVDVITTYPNYPEGKLYRGYNNKKITNENIGGVKVIRIPSALRGKNKITLAISYISFYKQAIKYLKKVSDKDYDIVYCYQLSPVFQAIAGQWYAKKFNKPFFIYCLDIWPESIRSVFSSKYSIIYKIVKKISKKIYNSANMIGVTSRSFIKYLHGECFVPYEKMMYLPQHADDIARGNNLATIENQCIDIVFTGNIGEAQNIDLVIDAVKIIENIEGFKIHIVGGGSLLKHAMERVGKENLVEKIIFYGRKPYFEMINFYQLADACLLTLNNKTLTGSTVPAKLQTYMAAGKIIIASVDGDAANIINEAQCGICVPANNAKALADAMCDFIFNKEKYQLLGKNARKYYDVHFTIERHIDNLNSCFKTMVKENESINN